MPTPGTVEFPTALDGVVSLFEVNNRAYTTLSADINNSVLAIPLADSTVFPATGVVTLTDSLTAPTKHEEIIYTANAANSLTVPVGGRGAFGSTAQNWSGTVYVRMRMIAEHHEVVRDAVIQLEAKLGYGSATPTVGKFLVGNTTAGTSTWRVLASGDIPDLSATYEPANANIQAHIASTSNPHSVTKSQVGLGNVENTALSTWAGSTNLTTLGTIATGVWNGSVIGSSYGGAGSISGILKANGSGVVSAASAGTDYLGVTAPGSSGNLIYNNANAYAAASLVNYSASAAVALTVTSNANGALFVRESTSGSTPFLIQDFPALFTLQNTDGSTFWHLAYTNDAAPNAYANFLQDAGHLTFSAVRSSDDAGLGDTHILPFGGIAIDNTAHTNTSFGMVYQSGNDIYALGRDNAFDLAETPANVDLTWGSRGITFRAPASAIADGDLAATHLHFYQDEATNELKAKWKESGGSVNTITFGSGGASNPFDDATAIIKGSGDATKLLRIEVDGITTGTTRVWTAPDANLTVAGIDLAQTWTASQTFGSGILRATSPQVTTGINDSNGNELFLFTATGSAVNELTIANAATGNAPTISATGGDTNIGLTLSPKGAGIVDVSASARTGTAANVFRILTPADTALTASTQSVLNQFGGNTSGTTVTRQFSTGALTTQRENVFVAPTYAFVGASTITTAATVSITGAPTSGTNATITNALALNVEAGQSRFPNGTAAAPSISLGSNNYGIYRGGNAGNAIVIAVNGSAWVTLADANTGDGIVIDSGRRLAWGTASSASGDLFLRRSAAAHLAFGATDAASPVAQTLSVQGGSGTNIAGATWTQRASLGTGNAVPGRLHITGGALSATSGTTQQTAVDRAVFNATKVLTNNSAITITNVTVASNSNAGGQIGYLIEVTDGTDFQYETGVVSFGVTNKGGVFSGNTATKFGNHQNATSGTLTVTFAISGANPALLSCNANSSLTPSTGYPRITYWLMSESAQAIAIQ